MIKRQFAFRLCLLLAMTAGMGPQPARAALPPVIPASTLVVTTLDDELNGDGDCSLREAITAANTNAAVDACVSGAPGADTLTFGVTGTITLSSSLPAIADALTIDGPGAASLTISGNNAVGVLTVNAGKTLNLRKVTIANGHGNGPSGIFNNGGTLTVADSTIANNRGLDGGGIYNSIGGSVELIDSTLSGNIAEGWGGGIFNAGTFTITRSSLIGNRAVHTFITYGGGGIANRGTLRVISSTLSGNVADCFGCPGGGIYNMSGGGAVTLINSTLSGNTARSGGGLFNQSSSGIITIIHSTLYDNRGPVGGANLLTFGGPILLRNSIVAIPAGSSNCYTPIIVNGGHNLQFPNASCSGTIPVANPLLGPLQDNGGSTFTHALLAGSPAIDAVPAADCLEAPTDQRGVTRPQGPACDIGAFEVVVNQPPSAEAGGPYSVDEGGAVTLTASGSDPEGQALTYAWDLDDNGTFETPGQSATFSAAGLDGPGTRTIGVQVTDGGGLSATDQATIDILNVAPTVSAGPDVTLIQGQVFSASGSFGDPGPDTWSATVDYGDGSGVQAPALAGQAFTLNHLYTTARVYTVVVAVTDDDGGTGTDTLSVTVQKPQDAIDDLIALVRDRVNRGVLNGGQGNALIAKLEAAIRQLDRGNVATAINQLESFINQVNALMSSGILPPEEGQPLIDAASEILAALGH